MPLQHVVALDTHPGEVLTRKAASGDQCLQVFEPNSPVIINAQKGGKSLPGSTQKTPQDEPVELQMRKGGNQGVPGGKPSVRLEIGPVFGEADLDIAQGAAGASD